ncbi:hypothetical protein H8356DRAFT_974495 [Neocallimastix lanati (nom. inval.)]|uniref:Tubby C-terminal domain-containing protein n=1 Tax=Neocallimastix californiae TaxID=1754190 RepID=A0A1Y2F4X0_9FUNG|nr:hypothetical protein H8356DRAFT_974495 [Neocallimastix sp. JGI-2020a]ORY78717.1 hypothetical protein LY90DRAFT_500905 [Neocallimastix californiae]|eukprot:ORY78717.1 hypothetical protein LY90DRAFT_500905 [Neocallimastix californiae]
MDSKDNISKENTSDNELNNIKKQSKEINSTKANIHQKNKEVTKFDTVSIDHKIIVTDEKYLSNKHIILRLKPSTMNKSKFVVLDHHKKELFNCIIHSSKPIQNSISDSKGNVIINFDVDLKIHSKTSKLYIYTETDDVNKQKITFNSRNSMKAIKYTVEFASKSGKEEMLDVIYDKSKIIHIYYGKMKEGGSLICKADTHSLFKNSSKIEIAPGIDIIFMMTVVFTISQLIQSMDELNYLVLI